MKKFILFLLMGIFCLALHAQNEPENVYYVPTTGTAFTKKLVANDFIFLGDSVAFYILKKTFNPGQNMYQVFLDSDNYIDAKVSLSGLSGVDSSEVATITLALSDTTEFNITGTSMKTKNIIKKFGIDRDPSYTLDVNGSGRIKDTLYLTNTPLKSGDTVLIISNDTVFSAYAPWGTAYSDSSFYTVSNDTITTKDGVSVVSLNAELIFEQNYYENLILYPSDSVWLASGGYFYPHPSTDLIYTTYYYGNIFSGSSNESAFGTGMFKYNAVGSTNIYAIARIMPMTAPSITDTVVFNLYTGIQALGSTTYQDSTALVFKVPMGGYSQYEQVDVNIDTIMAPSTLAGASLYFRLYRQSSNTSDTYAGDLHVPVLRYRYEANKLGE